MNAGIDNCPIFYWGPVHDAHAYFPALKCAHNLKKKNVSFPFNSDYLNITIELHYFHFIVIIIIIIDNIYKIHGQIFWWRALTALLFIVFRELL